MVEFETKHLKNLLPILDGLFEKYLAGEKVTLFREHGRMPSQLKLTTGEYIQVALLLKICEILNNIERKTDEG